MDPDIYSQPSPLSLSEFCSRQGRYIITYCLLLLCPLLIATCYFSYDKGLAYEQGPVTITFTSSYLEGGRRVESSVRGNGGMYISPHTEYQVWAKTADDRRVFIDVTSYIEFIGYQKGDVLDTPYSFHKQKGVWGWTLLAAFTFKLWVLALVILIIRVIYKGKKEQQIGQNLVSSIEIRANSAQSVAGAESDTEHK